MPELPEIETITRGLDAAIRGATITGLSVRHPDVLREGTAANMRKRTVGATITRSWRRAKLAVIDFSTGDRLVVQPRFTGALLIDAGDLPARERKYSTLHFDLHDGRALHYRDIRRLGTVTLMNPARFSAYTGALGPEPLDPAFTAAHLFQRLSRSDQSVKKLIMDQRQLVGVGNIYANESLWRARIDPSRSARRLSRADAGRLHEAIVSVLNDAIAARGTSFRDYLDPHAEAGTFAVKLDAYGRAGLPCRRCGHRLIGTHAIDGRQTVFCAHCA